MHYAHPTCPVIEDPRLILRHYHAWGEEYMVRRYAARRERMSFKNTQQRLGTHFMLSDHLIRETYRTYVKCATEIDKELP
jgi:hypothetical protein